jgi:hypothetical protein
MTKLKKARSCLLQLLLLVVLPIGGCALYIWSTKAPARDAARAREAIQPGMTAGEAIRAAASRSEAYFMASYASRPAELLVHPTLHGSSIMVQRGEAWAPPRWPAWADELDGAIAAVTSAEGFDLKLTWPMIADTRAILDVELGPDGKVTKVGAPRDGY